MIVDLVVEAVAVILLGKARRGAVHGEALGEPLLRLALQLLAFVEAGGVGARSEIREDGFAGLHARGAAHGDLDARLQRVRQVREQLHHLLTRLEMMLRRQAAAFVVGDDLPLRDRKQRVVRLIILRRREEGLVRRHDGQAVAFGERQQFSLDQPLILQSVPLDLNIELMAEGALEDVEPRLGQILASAVAQRRIEGAGETARQCDQSLAVSGESRSRDARILPERHAEIGVADQAHEIAVALLVLGEQDDVRRLRHHAGDRIRLLEADRELHAGDGLDAGTRELFGKLEGAEEIVGVGERERRLLVRRRELGELRNLQGTLEQRIRGMHMQMDKADIVKNARHETLLVDGAHSGTILF